MVRGAMSLELHAWNSGLDQPFADHGAPCVRFNSFGDRGVIGVGPKGPVPVQRLARLGGRVVGRTRNRPIIHRKQGDQADTPSAIFQ